MRTFPVMFNVKNRIAIVIGAGAVARRKIAALRNGGAIVRVISDGPPAAMDDLRQGGVDVLAHAYRAELLAGAMLVLACTDDRELNARIAQTRGGSARRQRRRSAGGLRLLPAGGRASRQRRPGRRDRWRQPGLVGGAARPAGQAPARGHRGFRRPPVRHPRRTATDRCGRRAAHGNPPAAFRPRHLPTLPAGRPDRRPLALGQLLGDDEG